MDVSAESSSSECHMDSDNYSEYVADPLAEFADKSSADEKPRSQKCVAGTTDRKRTFAETLIEYVNYVVVLFGWCSH